MRYDLILGWGMSVSEGFDRDGELEIWNDNNDSGFWLSREEVIKLRDHLNKVLGDD